MNLLSLYENADNASILHSRYYVEGVVLGATAAPEIPMPDVWLPWAIKHHGQMKNNKQADAITDDLFAYFKWCLSRMRDNNLALPAYCKFDTDENKEALSQWLQGLLAAHSSMHQTWQHAWDKMQSKAPDKAPKLAKDLKHCLSMFSTFADVELAAKQALERGDKTLDKQLPIIAKSLANSLSTYVNLSGELAAYLPHQFETFVQENDAKKQ